ncbi:MDR family MFS transporter [Clostridium luticellarii]|jgi:DHA2 family lincomycin resistance protein-like MFS transporter|uniref:MDR family MFS transporter n=1 Tax=Clostridium luticellarii TaxID=1691940 RepID=UPI002356B48C|nr:MDR family MFS transporter [Clostridium luticellarii]MCI1944421.1 DHA2 family efflux MFS transporter permease subunit [Clostridium luticellarii]MCI1969141.1 DHA2 family efflux MFS transporter permease subunit [Clostridium luticellarii]MCI1995053.1 DHA2 family efflux MFS transporter permease subunit [Clostridium luticellarii]MCI2039508.1 DHA2 family efflux MFS transporter permease subunit [Clostridium luticellarii]
MLQQENYLQSRKYNKKVIMFTLLLGSFIALFNETILNIAFPKLMAEMNVGATTVQWLTTGYVLVIAILMPVTAFLMNTFTTKRLFMGAVTLFLIGTICAFFSASFPLLLISRIIQAFGTSMMIPILINTALAIHPREKRGLVMGTCICVVSLGPAFGPTFSGILLQYFSWHILFLVLTPFLVICLVLGYIFLENVNTITKPKIDYLSILLSAAGIACIIYSISSMSTVNILVVLGIFIAGVISVILFCRRQTLLKQPMLQVKSFKYPVFARSMLIIMIIQMLQFSMNIILPMVLENGFKTSSLVTGIVLLPATLFNALLSPMAGKVYDNIGGKIVIPGGVLLMCISTFILSNITKSNSILTIVILYCFICIGSAMAASNTQTTALNQLPDKFRADGIAIINTLMQIAGCLGSSLFLGIMSIYENKYLIVSHSKISAAFYGFTSSIRFAAIILVIGFILSLTLKYDIKNKLR